MEETTTNNNTTTTTEETDTFEQCLNTPDYWFLHWKHSQQLHMSLIALALGVVRFLPEKCISDNLRAGLDIVGVGLLFTRLFTSTTADHLKDLYFTKLKIGLRERSLTRH